MVVVDGGGGCTSSKELQLTSKTSFFRTVPPGGASPLDAVLAVVVSTSSRDTI